MTQRYSIRDEALDDLALILTLSAEDIQKLNDSLDAEKATIISASKLLGLARQVVAEKSKSAAFVRQALFVAELSRESARSAEMVVDDVFDSYFGMRPDAERPSHFDQMKNGFSRFSSSNHLIASSKAVSLSFSSPNIFRDSSLIVDLRPIYDAKKSDILGMICVQHLTLDFMEGGFPREVSLAVDRADIEKLKRICEEALAKIEVATKFSSDRCALEVIVAGEETYAFRD